MKQSQAVYEAVVSALNSSSIQFVEGETNVKELLTKEIKSSVIETIKSQLISKTIPLRDTKSNQEKLEDPKLLHNYATGLVSNWLNRDPRLNPSFNGTSYMTGTRKFSKDEVLQELKLVLKKVMLEENEDGIAKAKNAIRERVEELQEIEDQNTRKELEELKDIIQFEAAR